MKKNRFFTVTAVISVIIALCLCLNGCGSSKKAKEEAPAQESAPETTGIESDSAAAASSENISAATQGTDAGKENASAENTSSAATDVSSDEQTVNQENTPKKKGLFGISKETKEEKAARKEKEKAEKEAKKAKEKEEKERLKNETPEERKARKAKEKEEKKQQKALEKEQKKLQKEAEKLERKQKTDNYTGWVYVPERNFSIVNGDIKLTMRGATGSFGIYAIPEKGKERPLLATYDEFCSTFFSLMVGRKEYRLNREAGVIPEARKTAYGAQMAYTIPDKVQCVVDFSFMPSIATSTKIDMMRVTVYTINLGKSTQAFTVKGVFDTMLGENTLGHFSTAAHNRINSETQYLDMSTERWIRSSNEKAAIQFLLNGRGITNPRAVTLANKDILSAATWLPVVKEHRSFSSVLAYNNSAMAVNWKTAYLDPLKTDVITFYIAVATDDNEPAGKEFLASLTAGRTALPSNLPESVQKTTITAEAVAIPDSETETAFYENMPPIAGDSVFPSTADPEDPDLYVAPRKTSPKESDPDLIEARPYEPVVSSLIDSSPVVENKEPEPEKEVFKTGNPEMPVVTKMQLDPEYIQSLLDRIADMESDPALVDRAEVERLNRELDVILDVLRGMDY